MTATAKAPTAPRKDPETTEAPLDGRRTGPVVEGTAVETVALEMTPPGWTEVTMPVPRGTEAVADFVAEVTTPFPPVSAGVKPPEVAAVEAADEAAALEDDAAFEDSDGLVAVLEGAAVLEVEEDLTFLQLRSYRGVELKVEPTIPKLGLGVVGKESWRVNQNVLILPKSLEHPTSSQ